MTDHRAIAAQTYNATWSLLETTRTEAQDRDLLGLAMTSRYHWQQVGGAQELAVADWMVSRCLAALGSELAVGFAQAALDRVTDEFPAWLRASLHEGMARASVAGRDEHVALARAALAQEPDDEDRALIESQLADL